MDERNVANQGEMWASTSQVLPMGSATGNVPSAAISRMFGIPIAHEIMP